MGVGGFFDDDGFDDDAHRYRVTSFVNLSSTGRRVVTPPKTAEQKAREELTTFVHRAYLDAGGRGDIGFSALDECGVERWSGSLNVSVRPMLDDTARRVRPGSPPLYLKWLVSGVEVDVGINYHDAQVSVGGESVYCQRASMGGLHRLVIMPMPSHVARHFGLHVGLDLEARCIYSHVPDGFQVSREWVEYVYKAAEDLVAAQGTDDLPEVNVNVSPTISPTFNNHQTPPNLEALVEALVMKHLAAGIERLLGK